MLLWEILTAPRNRDEHEGATLQHAQPLARRQVVAQHPGRRPVGSVGHETARSSSTRACR